MDKPVLRSYMIAERAMLSAHTADEASRLVSSRLITETASLKLSRVHIYRSNESWNEISTRGLGRLLPDFHPDVTITFGDVSLSALLPDSDFDLIIVPLLAFDERKHRLGFGGGWYDRFLAAQPNALKIGLGYEFQRSGSLPVEPHDIALDMIITEAKTYR
jgi:5-formyltetrahydrofolate cyclo-ligase